MPKFCALSNSVKHIKEINSKRFPHQKTAIKKGNLKRLRNKKQFSVFLFFFLERKLYPFLIPLRLTVDFIIMRAYSYVSKCAPQYFEICKNCPK